MLPRRWRAALPVVSAVVVVACLSLLTVTIMSSIGSDDDERAFVDADGSTTTTTTDSTTRRRAPRPVTTTEAPEVLGETTERQPDATADPAVPLVTPSTPASPITAAPAAPPATAPPTAPAPSTSSTTAPCRNSTEESCGTFSWDPQPGPYDVEVYAVSTPIAARAGEPVTFAVDYVDPAGPDAEGACLNWSVSDPAVVNTSSCEVIATSCARTGPHDPPAPSRERIALERSITFETPGEHEVTIGGNIATHLPDGCESPYRNTFTRTFTIVVS